MQTQLKNEIVPKQMQLAGLLSQQCLFTTTDYQVTETTDDFIFRIPKKILLDVNFDKNATNSKDKKIQEKLDKFHQLLTDSKDFQVRTRQDIDEQIANERNNWDME
ncbi:MAG: hypothetical protein KGV51_02595 [Moraxellaceae bacterium]|nr:hypothetical protein [Moraxellaceae bacterium]